MLSLQQPWALAALPLLAVPIILHLINRRRARPFAFPSIRFLTISPLPRKGERKIQDWLLLLLRMLLFAIFIALMAGPTWSFPSPSDEFDERPALLILDASASMDGWNRFEEAREASRSWLRQQDMRPVGLIVYARDVLTAIPPNRDHTQIDEILSTLQPTVQRGVPMAAFDRALSIHRETETEEWIWISDFHRSDWGDFVPPRLPQGLVLNWQRISGRRDDPNSANVLIERALVAPGENGQSRILADLRNDGPAAVEGTLQLLHEAGLETSDYFLAPAKSQRMEFTLAPGISDTAMLSLEDDLFAGDNQYALWTGRLPSIRVLLPSSERESLLDSSFFLSQALSVEDDTRRVHFDPLPTRATFLSAQLLDTMDALVLPANVLQESDLELGLIRDFVDGGGLLLLTLANEAARTAAKLELAGLLPAEYSGIRGRQGFSDTRISVEPPAPGSTIARIFTGESLRDLLLIDLRRYVQLRPHSIAEVLLAADTGDPLILHAPIGEGHVIAFAFPFQPDWTDLPLRNAFLPVISELIREYSARKDPVVSLPAGDPLPPSLSNAAPGLDTSVIGSFEINNVPVEINISRDESDPFSLSVEELDRIVLSTGPIRELDAVKAGDEREFDEALPEIDLWPYLLGAAFLAFLTECFFAALGLKPRRTEEPITES